MDNKKPIDIADERNVDTDKLIQPEEKTRLAERVQELFRGAYFAKLQLQLNAKWKKFDDYKHGRQNPPQTPDDPGSVTNIIHPIIESQIADLIDKPYSVDGVGEEPSDDLFAEDAKHLLEYVLDKNRFKIKLNVSEHDRLELGTTIIKTYFDHDALDGKGLPTFEVVNPANFFPDPKVWDPDKLQEGEFVIHAVPRPLSYFRKRFPEYGKYVVREVAVPYDPTIYTDSKSDETSYLTSQRALLIECYMKDEEGKVYCVSVANYIVLEDTRETLKEGKSYKSINRRNQYPFVMIPCYPQRGQAWGQGDVELLIPTQDLINELDDQIRMNARLMGNPQIVVGMGAGKGFDYRKWTNKPGLRIPMRDQNSYSIVKPTPVSSDVPVRREKAFDEANIISGRPDVNRGERPGGGVTAASAIIALQNAGQKSVVHKAEMFKLGWKQVLELLMDEIMENWDEEMWVRIEGKEPDFKFINPTQLKQVPIKIPVIQPMNSEDTVKDLTDEQGQPMTREAQFDINLSLGNGLPSDKAFIYQTILDLSKAVIEGKSLITWSELRKYLRNEIGLPLDSDEQVQSQQEQQMLQQSMMQSGGPQAPPLPLPTPTGGGLPVG